MAINIEKAIWRWIRWKGRLDSMEIRRACGVKSSGIEYRLMLMEGQVKLEPREYVDEQLVMDVDTVWARTFQWYPEEMEAVKIFYSRGKSFRAVRTSLGCSQHMSRKLVRRGEDMIRGGLASICGYG